MATKAKGTKPKEEAKQKPATKEVEQTKAEPKTYMYIGPSIDGFLMQNTTVKGTLKDIRKTFNKKLEKHPKLERLFIPIEKLGETKLVGVLEQYCEQITNELRNKEVDNEL